ncbi:GntR family transcriptional regulator [Roseiconus nitratireducens]|uniref:GntR family transcriptional regulator n=1 Tax=Roseiconus nitratireducens TaxID=2605748 RepID=A0A5M6DNL9_9BACT|nr:GntR family transcriptional regulator [Roseiconus nitratireducens]KAA5547025.1 GntR family transcriptional regulator [Roseiconus nitratireducens]
MNCTHAQLAYRHLRGRLIAGEFAPGTRIRYGPVGQELGISATPVREAMGLLANEGFVELVPQLGAVVRTVSRDELVELYEMREAIEPYAACKAAERASETQLEAIARAVDRMESLATKVKASKSGVAGKRETAEFEKHDLAFHMLVIEATGNQTMVRSSESSNALMRVFATERHGYDAAIMRATCDDHTKILRAIQQGKGRQAEAAMRQHIVAGLNLTLNTIESSRSRRWETP